MCQYGHLKLLQLIFIALMVMMFYILVIAATIQEFNKNALVVYVV